MKFGTTTPLYYAAASTTVITGILHIIVASDISRPESNYGRIQMFTSDGQFITKFGETGSGDGQLSDPEGVGVDKESGAVYVADTGNNRIQLFEHK